MITLHMNVEGYHQLRGGISHGTGRREGKHRAFICAIRKNWDPEKAAEAQKKKEKEALDDLKFQQEMAELDEKFKRLFSDGN